ncbi:PAS domain-containing protein [Azospirillum sp. CT11-132]|uniref:PAS domain-containing protein n=1 Tax=Azospirillum sp. CT11-132 TaxID=3396317 RepID=UPI0039A77B10
MPSRFFHFLPLAVLPLLVFEIVTQLNLRDTREVEIRQEAARLLDLVVTEQHRLVEDVRHVLGTVASIGDAELGAPDCQASFERMKPHLPDALIIQFADRQGIVRCSTNRQTLGAFIGDRPNVQRALATSAFAIGGYSVAQGVGDTIFTFGLPYVGPDGQSAGVLTALLDLRWLKDYLSRKPLPPDTVIVLADRDGTILARAPEMPGLVGQTLPQQYRFMLEGPQRSIAEVVGDDGIKRVVAYSPVRADVTDLMVWVGLGKDHAMRPVEEAMWRTLAVFVGLLGLAVLVTAWAVRHVAQLRDQSVRTALRTATVLESTTDAVLEVDRNWRVTFVNERARSILARDGDLIGQVFWEAYPELVGTEAWSRAQQAMNAQSACEFEIVGPLSRRWYSARAFPSKDGLAIFFQDVSARKAAEQEREELAKELTNEQTLLKGVLEHLPSGVFAVAAPDGRLLLHNSAAERLIGHSVHLAQSVEDYAAYGAVHPDGSPYRPDEYPLARALLFGEREAHGEMRYRRGDGTITTFAVSAAPVRDPDGKIVMAVSIFHDISELKRAEEALRRSEERLAFALASARAGTFDTDLQTGTIHWSAESYQLFGVEPNGEGIRLETWFALIHPEDRNRVLAERERIVREADPHYDVEHRVLRPDGRSVWVAVLGRFVFGDDGTPIRASGLYLDITARKTAEEALRRSEERLNFALASAAAGTWDWDIPSGDLTWCGGMYRLHGLSPEHFTPSYEAWLPFVHPDDRSHVQNTVLTVLASTSDEYRIEHRIIHPVHGERWLMGVGRIVRDDRGAPLRLTGVSLDITVRKRMEEDLRSAKQEAERASLAKSKFLAAASHDLRQPLQSMALFGGALHAHVKDGRGRDMLLMLERGTETMKSLLDSLLDVSRLDAEVAKPQLSSFDLDTLIQEITDSYRPLAATKGLSVLSDGSCCGVAVRSDRTMLGRIIRNLVENAVRYTEHGGITVSWRIEKNSAWIDVADTGIGIPVDQIAMIFDEFHQIGNPERDRSRGLGLGLSIVQRLARILAHEVRVRSTLGEGSVFSVQAPVSAGTEVPEDVTEDNQTRSPIGRGRLALVIDDDTIVLMSLRTLLEEWGYDTLISGSSEQALAIIADDGRCPDVIVADYRLRAGRNGCEATRDVRNHLGLMIPGIILTGETGAECAQDIARYGLEVIHKPVMPGQLSVALEKLLGGTRKDGML